MVNRYCFCGKKYYAKGFCKLHYYSTDEAIELRKRRDARYKVKARLEAFSILGKSKCSKCGNTDMRVLQLDHIKGDGYKAKREYFRTMKEIVELKKNPAKFRSVFQVLCSNCNWIKRYENSEQITTKEWKDAFIPKTIKGYRHE